MKLLEKLFRKQVAGSSSDQLTQAEREAIIDLLLYSTYVDNYLSFTEEKVLNNEIESFNWESGTAVDSYIAAATARVRAAKSGTAKEDDFLSYIKTRLVSKYAKTKAKETMNKLLQSDGKVRAEVAFAGKVDAILQ